MLDSPLPHLYVHLSLIFQQVRLNLKEWITERSIVEQMFLLDSPTLPRLYQNA
jgi:hypothetical protein